ncbi:ABC-type transport system, involved in lipoprotein release, permease component [Paenibacillaceae bacterium GAS479]|nr:ABC-type transport system, involved in lipoprotein release, permease component [Paenibacillaceae bacterium GAS479]
MLIVIGFFIGSLVMSLGTSAAKESMEYIKDQKGGDPEQQLDIFLSDEGEWNQKDTENIVERISEFGEIQLLSLESRKLDQYGDTFPVVPVLFYEEENWHIPLVSGKYFSTKDMEEKKIILGKSIAEKHKIQLGDQLEMAGVSFTVIGIGGRSTRETSWEHAIYMPWKSYRDLYGDFFLKEKNAVSIRLKSGKDQFEQVSKEFTEMANLKGIQLIYKEVNDVDSSSLRNTLVITTVSTVLIYTIAIINIVYLMLYWVMERRREIGIFKAIGANNRYIAKVIVLELLLMSVIGGSLAVLMQYLMMILFSGPLIKAGISIQVSWLNLFSALGVSLFFGMISSISPIIKVIRLDPIHVIHLK